jgi:sugar lactone lactonase YvrE
MIRIWQRRSARSTPQITKRLQWDRRALLGLEQLEGRVTPSTLIPVPNHRDLVFDPIHNMLDITTSAGSIQRYSLALQSLLDTLPVGTSLNGADISPDGSTLYVAEQQTSGSQGVIHEVSLATGAVTNLPYNLASGEGGSWDIALGSNGKGMVDGTSPGGWAPLRQLDLSSGTLSVRTDDPGSGGGGLIRANTLLHRSADRTLLLVTEAGLSSGPMFTYNAVSDSFGTSINTGIDLSNALSAVSRNGNLVALEYNGTVVVTDRSFNEVTSLPNQDGGVAFDPLQDVLYTVNSAKNQITAFDTNTWAAKFQMPIGENVTPGSAFGNGVMTVSNDGSLLFLATPSGVRMFNLPTNGGPAATLSISGFPSATNAGTTATFTVTALDANAQIATGYRGTVYFASSDAQAALPAGYTFTAADAGVHTFTATFKTAGSQAIYGKDINTPSINGAETGIGVYPAAVASYRISAPASPQASGYAFNITVSPVDAYNNTVTNYTGTVHFTSSDSAAILPPNYTFTPSDNGVHSFSVNLQTAGNLTITATDTSNSTVTGSAAVTVANYIPGLHFGVTASVSSTVAGTPFSVTVIAYDLNNNVATRYVGTAQFYSSDEGAGAAVPAAYTFTPGDAGVHVFTNGVTLVTAGHQSITVADSLDMTGSTAASTSITVNPASAAALLSVGGFTSQATAGSAGTFTVTARDAYGNVATGYSGTVHFTSSDSQAVLPADAALTNGSGTFSAIFKTAGKQSLTATDTMNPAITGSQSGFTINPAAANSFRITGFPSPTTAGNSGLFTVTALDPYGNVATGYSGSVHVTSTDSQASLPSNANLVNGTNGFGATLRTAGTQSLTVTDTVNASITGAQAGITVSPGTAISLRVSTALQVTAGVATTAMVSAVDAYGNVATSYGGTVHFSSSDSRAVLPGDAALTNGTGSFAVIFKTAGGQSLTATDTASSALTGIYWGIPVSPAAASTLRVSGPNTATAGSAFSVKVTALDPYNNTVTGYLGSVHFTSSDTQATLPADHTFAANDSGVHTFTVTLRTAVIQSVTATDSANSLTGTQAGISVGAATASRLIVAGFPSTTTAGVAGNVTVTAKDPYGNTVNLYTDTVSFSSTDGGGASGLLHLHLRRRRRSHFLSDPENGWQPEHHGQGRSALPHRYTDRHHGQPGRGQLVRSFRLPVLNDCGRGGESHGHGQGPLRQHGHRLHWRHRLQQLGCSGGSARCVHLQSRRRRRPYLYDHAEDSRHAVAHREGPGDADDHG